MRERKERLVSVIVPAYNSGKYVSRCLESILQQTYGNIDIIVVYSPSSDDTLEKIAEYQDLVTLVKSPVRLIPSKARNVGLHRAHGDYVAFCDADDYWAPNKIKNQFQVQARDSCVGVTYTDVLTVSDDNLLLRKVRTPDWNFKLFLKSRFIVFSSVMIKKDILEAAGLFDEDVKFYGVEDFDLLIRLSRLTSFRKVPGYYTFYRVSTGGISHHQLWRIMARGNVYKKHNMTQLYLKNRFEYIWILTLERLRASTPQSLRQPLKRTLRKFLSPQNRQE